MTKAQRALFLDRDGVVNAMVYDPEHGTLDSPYVPERLHVLPGVAALVRRARELGFLVFVATNQPGFAKGMLTEERLERLHAALREQLAREGATLDGIYVCRHHPDGGPEGDRAHVRACGCRKPKPGLLLEAAREHGIDLARSYMVGDGFTDIEAGRAAGCTTALVSKLYPHLLEALVARPSAVPDILVSSLAELHDDLESGEVRHPWPFPALRRA